MSQFPSTARTDDRAARIRALVDECLRRRAAGEELTDETLIVANAKLMPELGEELRKLRTDVGGRDFATIDSNSHATKSEDADTLRHEQSDSNSGRLEVRCPGCQLPVIVAADTRLTDLTCGGCGRKFSLVSQNKKTWNADPLTKLGRFELIERLGVGGFGSVWKARDRELDRTVALKLPRNGDMTAEEQSKFFREARAAAQLRHPAIVSVHEVGRDGTSVYIVSDYVRGVTLGDWLSTHEPSPEDSVRLCQVIASALQHAHEQGVVHRDLKPANIMIDLAGNPHLMDFGLARREVGEETLTVEGNLLGTPAYMSPEQAEGKAHTADRRSDIYSLGVILFQLLTGELPFRGNLRMLMHQVIHDEPPSPRKLNSTVPRDLETITLKCLEKSPANRYQTAADLDDEFGRFLRGEQIHARPLSAPAHVLRWAQRKPMMASTCALVVFLAITGPLAALRIHGLLRSLKVRFDERDNLVQKNEMDRRRTDDQLQAMRRQLDAWEGRANPYEFWPPKSDDSMRRNLVADLLRHAESNLASQLKAGKFDSENTARGYLGLAAITEALGRNAEARAYLESARDHLGQLRKAQPQQVRFSQALADCELRLARLSARETQNRTDESLEQARTLYQHIASQRPTDARSQIDHLESEWSAAKLSGFDGATAQLESVSRIKQSLPEKWPKDPGEFYNLANYLTAREPVLNEKGKE